MSNPSCPILLLDGGLGTTLEGPPYNVRFSPSTPLWSSHLLIDNPKTLLDAQSAFARAGADILLTATYQASYDGFKATLSRKETSSSKAIENDNPEGIVEDWSALKYPRTADTKMRLAVSIAREAISLITNDGDNIQHKKAKLVALSLGGYGACMTPSQEYTGLYLPESFLESNTLKVWHQTRMRTFQDDRPTWNEIDLVAFETIPLREEICAIRCAMAIAEASGALSETPSKPWYISCVFPNDDLKLPDSTPVYGVVEAMLANDKIVERREYRERSTPWGIGINCTKVSRLAPLIEAFEAAIQRIEGEGRLNSEERCEDSSTWLRDSPHSKWPWLVLYPDGTQNEKYNTSTQTWEADANDKTESVRSWDEQVIEIVKDTRQKGLWPGILVGGCCRTSPEDIKSLRMRIDTLEQVSENSSEINV
ncbi:hypothetical protein MMC34_004943 [Xylographa carneopallida]|nr:hypothetical protein [Xylographa carneopallida]